MWSIAYQGAASMYQPEIQAALVVQHQADIRRTVADEQRVRSAKKEQQDAAEQGSPRSNGWRMLRLRWSARRQHLARRRYPADWRNEVLAIAHHRYDPHEHSGER